MTALIELKDVTKEYNGQVVLRGIDLTIHENEFVTLLGPSGCGKTTILRIIGGFVEPASGDVLFQGQSMRNVPPHKRPTNTVFQRYALFPHLNVFENIAFGLRVKNDWLGWFQQWRDLKRQYRQQMRGITDPKLQQAIKQDYIEKKSQLRNYRANHKIRSQEISSKVHKYLKLVGLEGYENRTIHELSGGQQQRVAIARALINEPKVLLLDEPLAALDLKLRQEMQYELKEIQRNAGITFIFVTHDQEEALTMSDRIVVMNHGEIQQVGTPVEIYNDPINTFVASFIGESNILQGIVKNEDTVTFDGQDFTCSCYGFYAQQAVDVLIRPEDIDIVEMEQGLISGKVVSIVFKGVHYEIDVQTAARIYTIHTTDIVPLHKEVGLKFGPDDIHLMEKWL
jgi:spermidine/putrescine transport system ATP-binding protein